MFDIILYSFNKKPNSTKRPDSEGLTLPCLIKSRSSILNPLIELKTEPIGYNYCYIPKLKHYYFIQDYTYDSGIWILQCMMDELASYREEIGNSYLYVLRSASDYNGYIKDTVYPMTGRITKYKDSVSAQGGAFNEGYYVVNIAGTNTGSSTLYQLTPQAFSNLLNEVLLKADGFDWSDIPKAIRNTLFDPIKYINSVMWFPYSFIASPQPTNINIGWWSTSISGRVITSPTTQVYNLTYDIPKHPQSSARGKYLNLSPYSEYVLELQPFGLITLDTTQLIDVDNIRVAVYMDAITGQCNGRGYSLLESGQEDILFDLTAQFGVPIGITQDNISTSTISSALSFAGSVATSVAGAIESGGATIPLSLASASKGISDVASSVSGSVSNMGSSGSILNHIIDKTLYARFFEVVEEDWANLGRPLASKRTINTLPGFNVVANGTINLNTTQEIRDRIKSKLETGFYYE